MKFLMIVLLSFLSAPTFSAAAAWRVPVRKPSAKKPLSWSELQRELHGHKSDIVRANQLLAKHGLSIIRNRADFSRMIEAKKLVGIYTSRFVKIDPRLDSSRRYVAPGTNRFLRSLDALKVELTISSAARSIEDQRKIAGRNGNAGAISGPTVSPHLRGAAVDILYNNLSVSERVRVGNYLRDAKERGEIAVALERKQPVFHVIVLRQTTPSEKKAAPPKKQQSAPSKKTTRSSTRGLFFVLYEQELWYYIEKKTYATNRTRF